MAVIRTILLFSACAFAVAQAGAQSQKPATLYWMSVETSSMSVPGMPTGLAPTRAIQLQLSVPGQAPLPEATHDIPPGQNMGKTLPLLTPVRVDAGPPGTRQYERPKTKMYLYWGCGEAVRPGQPVVIDFAKVMDGDQQFSAGNFVSLPQPPGPARDRVYAEWPNEKTQVSVPRNSSLVGDHFVHGNYPPEIRFSITSRHDYMAPVVFTRSTGGLTDAISFQWDAVPTATGYFAMATGNIQNLSDLVFWSSSELQTMGGELMDFIPPAQVQRLIQQKVVMSAQTTQCAVPQGIFRESRGAMLSLVAYGDELNHVFPPKPADPEAPWDPIWYAKVRLKSTGMLPLGVESRVPRERPGSRQPAAGAGEQSQDAEKRPAEKRDSAPNPVEGVRRLKGLFGL